MKKHRVVGLNGKSITLYAPENDRDLEEIERMAKNGLIDTNVGFADYRNQATTGAQYHASCAPKSRNRASKTR